MRHEKEAILRKGAISKSRSRSRGQPVGSNMSSNEVLTLMPQKQVNDYPSGKQGAQTVKMYDGSDESAVPAWYKTLKKNFSK